MVTSVVNKRAEATGEPTTTVIRGPATTHVIVGKEDAPKSWVKPYELLYHSSSHEYLLAQQMLEGNSSDTQEVETFAITGTEGGEDCKAKKCATKIDDVENIIGLDPLSDHILLF